MLLVFCSSRPSEGRSNFDIIKQLALEFSVSGDIVNNVVTLIDDGNTIPFIARYRKEKTGSMDDQVLRSLSERLEYLRSLEERRAEVRKSIEAQGALDADIEKALDAAVTLSEIEDIYRPYRPKRRTRASIAREKGLGQLAESILEQPLGNPEFWGKNYVTDEMTLEEVMQGANDIIAEVISDDAAARKALREWLVRNAIVKTEAIDKEKQSVYTMYYDRSEPYARMPGHRVLAVNRGEKEGFLRVEITANEAAMQRILYNRFVKANNPSGNLVKKAADDALDRLIYPSLERELRTMLTDAAQEQAIALFAGNLRALLMQPPVKGKVVLGLDPAYRTGCKIAVVDATGKVLDTTVVYPTPPQNRTADAKRVLSALIRKHGVTVIAIGNGTASRESEKFVVELVAELGGGIGYVMVSEAGASVYSASKLGAEEFPEFDVSLRSAVSIARRLQDPLAELVKIDPKSVGVGQYQHDMPARRMDEALGGVVEDCVNKVGVDLNTASAPLLAYISGISKTLAKNIVEYREANGRFTNRKQLLKVAKLGPKAFEQCAGFMRITGGDNPLDATSVHPESYEACEKLLDKLNLDKAALANGTGLGKTVSVLTSKMNKKKLAEEIGVGELTLTDMIQELVKPARDPRDEMPAPILRSDVLDMKDLKPGMILKGTVRNVIDFGAFVDIGVHQDGLVHISQMSEKYIKHPLDAVKLGDVVEVQVMSVDIPKKRIALTMKIGKQ